MSSRVSGLPSRKRVSFSCGVRSLGIHEALVPHQADAHLAVVEGDEPDPVAPAGEVVRRESPRRQDRALPRVAGIGTGARDAVHVLHVAVPDPDRRDRVGVDRRDPAALAGEHRLPAGRVDEPAAGDRRGRAVLLLDREGVRPRAPAFFYMRRFLAAETPRRHLRGAPHLGALLAGDLEEVRVELRAVELEGRRPGELRRTGLRRLAQAVHVVVEEPVPERLLRELLAGEIRPLLQHPREEVGGHLDGRLADLPVETLGLLDDQDAELRVPALQHDRGRGAGDGAAGDDDVVGVPGRGLGALHGRSRV